MLKYGSSCSSSKGPSRTVSRRDAVSLFGTAAAVALVAAGRKVARAGGATPATEGEAGSLAKAAARAGVAFGAAIDRSAFEDAAYGALYLREAGLLASENAFKFASLKRPGHR